MAASASIVKPSVVPGAERYTVTHVTLDNNYVAGGYTLTAADLGLVAVDFAICSLVEPSTEDPVDGAIYDIDNEKLICLISGVEVADTTTDDLSDAVIQVVAFGR